MAKTQRGRRRDDSEEWRKGRDAFLLFCYRFTMAIYGYLIICATTWQTSVATCGDLGTNRCPTNSAGIGKEAKLLCTLIPAWCAVKLTARIAHVGQHIRWGQADHVLVFLKPHYGVTPDNNFIKKRVPKDLKGKANKYIQETKLI
jgi:hypothetical protein